MIIVSYDISNNKLRTRFSKFLSKFGGRLQYSVFEIKNSHRILKNIVAEIENSFSKQFGELDSVLILQLSKQCKVTSYGYAKHDEKDMIFID